MPTSGRLFSGGLRGGFFLSAAEVFVKNHIMFMFKFMKDCSIVPYFFGEDFKWRSEPGSDLALWLRLFKF